MSSVPWWVLPSLAALILVATHTYLGLHVISRNVFFVDLALAQIAALGSTVAFLYGFEQSDPLTYYVSLLFAVLGAWFFSAVRSKDERVPQEAIIGLSFAVASAGSILLSAENPHGAEHLRDMMAGSILVVSPVEVRNAAIFYAAIGLGHWILRRQFLLVSMDPVEARRRGMRVRMWDFLFYLSFAVVITSSVRIAGVLLVFCLLIAPAVCGALLADGIRPRLLIGWTCGTLATVGGLFLSYYKDWPPAPAIACTFALLLLVASLVKHVRAAERRSLAVGKIAAYSALLMALGYGGRTLLSSEFARRHGSAAEHATAAPEDDDHHHPPEHATGTTIEDRLHALKDEHAGVRAEAVRILAGSPDPRVPAAIISMLEDPDDAVVEAAAEAIAARPDMAGAVPALEQCLDRPHEDPYAPLRLGQALLAFGRPKGVDALLKLAANADAPVLARDEALRTVRLVLGLPPLPKKTSVRDASGKKALDEAVAWWTKHGKVAGWDANQKVFHAGK